MPKIYFSRTGSQLWTSRSAFARWNDLPYGIWTCPDGREVLFNRFYEPIWQRRTPGSDPEAADPFERVPYEKQAWFYNDGTRDKAAHAKAALAGWLVGSPAQIAPVKSRRQERKGGIGGSPPMPRGA